MTFRINIVRPNRPAIAASLPLLAWVLGISSPANAQESHVVITGSRRPQNVERASVRTHVVTRQEAVDRGATDVGEALALEPSLQVNPSAYDFIGKPSGVQIQGLDGSRVLILEDGERVIGGIGGVIDLSTLPLSELSQIEYITGPSSALYGSQALGGVVNLRRGPVDRIGVSGGGRLEVRQPKTLLSQGRMGLREGNTWLRVDASRRVRGELSLDSSDNGGRPTVSYFPRQQNTMLGLRGSTGLGDFSELEVRLRGILQTSEGKDAVERPGLGFFPITTPSQTLRRQIRAIWRMRLTDNHNLRLSVSHQRATGTTEKNYIGSVQREQRDRDGVLDGVEATGSWRSSKKLTWVYGIRGEREAYRQTLRKQTPSTLGFQDTTADEVPEISSANVAAYAQLEWKLSRRLRILPGGRYEIHRRYGRVFAPRIAMKWKLGRKYVLRAGGGRGFRAPSAKELGFNFDHSFFGYKVIGNRELAPERSWGLNGELSKRFKRGRIRVGAFGNWLDRIIQVDASGTDPAGISIFRYYNSGKARSSGMTAALDLKPHAKLRTSLSYSYLSTWDVSNASPWPSRPEHTVSASLIWDMAPGTRLNLQERYVHSAYISDTLATPGSVTINARFRRRVMAGISAYVGVQNILDQKRDPLRAGDQRPLFGRSFYLGISADLPPAQG